MNRHNNQRKLSHRQTIKISRRQITANVAKPLNLITETKHDAKQPHSVQLSNDKILIFTSPPGGNIDPNGPLKHTTGLAKGDLVTSDGTSIVRLPAGTNGNVLTADTTQSTGIKWSPGASGGTGNTVTFQPGGTNVGTTVFTNFGALSAFISSSSSIGLWTIQMDGRFAPSVGTVEIPTGTYPMPPSIEFVGVPSSTIPGNYPTLAGDSVVFNPVPAEVYLTNLPFISLNNFPGPQPFTANVQLNVYIVNCDIQTTAPMFVAGNGAFISIKMHNFSNLVSGSILSVDATSAAAVTAFDACTIGAGVISITPGGQVDIYSMPSSHIDPSYYSLSGATVHPQGVESGVTTLNNGVSPTINVDNMTATSRITLTVRDVNGSSALGILTAPTSGRTIGSPGSFVIHSVQPNTPANPATTDKSIVEWHMIDTGQ